MEDIWHNKPVDYLKNFKKQNKGRKKFTVSLQPYLKTNLPVRTIDIISTSMSNARYDAVFQLSQELKTAGIEFTGITQL